MLFYTIATKLFYCFFFQIESKSKINHFSKLNITLYLTNLILISR